MNSEESKGNQIDDDVYFKEETNFWSLARKKREKRFWGGKKKKTFSVPKKGTGLKRGLFIRREVGGPDPRTRGRSDGPWVRKGSETEIERGLRRGGSRAPRNTQRNENKEGRGHATLASG